MQEKLWNECAGELRQELAEIEKVTSPDESDAALSHTLHCGQFLTIYCC